MSLFWEFTSYVISKCVLSGTNSCSSCLEFFMASYILWNILKWSCIHFVVDLHSSGPAACVDTSLHGGNTLFMNADSCSVSRKAMTRFPIALFFQQRELPNLFLPLWQPGAFSIPARSMKERAPHRGMCCHVNRIAEHTVTIVCSILQPRFPLSLLQLYGYVYITAKASGNNCYLK